MTALLISNKYIISMFVFRLFHRFLGFCQPVERGIAGYLQCVQEASKTILPCSDVITIMSSIVMDGESLTCNSGDRNGL